MPALLHNVPIRTRVALAILSLSSVALVVMAAGVYLAFSGQVRRSFDDTLRVRAASNAALVEEANGVLRLTLRTDPGSERDNGVSLIRLFSPDGQLVADGALAVGKSSGEKALVLRAASGGKESLATLDYSGGERFRVIASPVINAGAVQGVLTTGLETAQVEEPLAILRVILLIAVPATSLGLAAGAFLIARRALRPIAAITASANRIASGDLRERIAGIGSHDEVGELAGTFNHMIDRIGETMARERRFTADAAHELRTPLAALEASIDVTLSQPRSTAAYQETLGAMRTQTVRLSALMRQLLLLSRVDTAALETTFDDLDLAAFLDAVGESFKDAYPAVTLVTSGLIEPMPYRGDSELLTRAFGNVLENAVIHGSPAVRISLDLVRAGAEARVIIHDNGPGIPAEIQDSAFQRFRRGDSARTHGGSGLGLAIVESIMRVHGGRVRLIPGAIGTTIELALPFRR